MILNALVERLQRRSKDDFKGRHFEAALILKAVSWYLRYPLGLVANSDMARARGWPDPNFHALLTCGRPKQSASSRFCSHTVQRPAKPKPLRSHSIASKP
jgi:hypothetical protein